MSTVYRQKNTKKGTSEEAPSVIPFTVCGENKDLVVLTLSSCFRLLLTSDAWLLVMLSLADLLLDTCLSTVTLKSAKCTV